MASFRSVPLSSTIKQWCPLEGVSHVAHLFLLKRGYFVINYSRKMVILRVLIGNVVHKREKSHGNTINSGFLAMGGAPPVWMSKFHNQSEYSNWTFSLVQAIDACRIETFYKLMVKILSAYLLINN
ncbi:hypothetical protein CsSME_00019823 [Camellia sinensis var. sinensis]